MAYANRKRAADLAVLAIGSDSLLTTFRDVSHTKTVAEVDVGAAQDTYRLVKGGRISGAFEGELIGEGAAVASLVVGAMATFSHDLNSASAVTGCGLITSVASRSGGVDGAQTIAWTMVQTS